MRRNRLVTVILTVLASIAFTMGSAVPAYTLPDEERNEAASRTNWGSSDICVDSQKNNSGDVVSKACFKKHGDYIFVKDMLADGDSVYVLWENELRTASGDWGLYRRGRCEFHGTSPNWGQCNKDFYENSTQPNAFGTKGSRISIRACANRDWDTDLCSASVTVLND